MSPSIPFGYFKLQISLYYKLPKLQDLIENEVKK